ncbi:MAG: sensor domain-containing diguanylate cyclase [Desulfarculus sp.]|nr:sensor domain-containing diguanylate cyclase [Desulfarculus sp.]
MNAIACDSLVFDILDALYDGVYLVDQQRRITFWNKGAEQLTGYNRQEVLGSSCADNILIHVDENGRNLCLEGCPLAQTLLDKQFHEAEVYLHHKDGHRIPVVVRVSPIRDQMGQMVGALEIFDDNSPRMEVRARVKELEQLAMLDQLTKLPNRRYLEQTMTGRLAELQRLAWPFGVIFMDIDHFKQVNDQYGHDVGDQVLVMVSRTLELNSRPFDLVGRWGGEEFLAIVPNVEAQGLSKVARRYLALVRSSVIFHQMEPLMVTISLGATLATPQDNIETLLQRADTLMYKSKQAGRDRISIG